MFIAPFADFNDSSFVEGGGMICESAGCDSIKSTNSCRSRAATLMVTHGQSTKRADEIVVMAVSGWGHEDTRWSSGWWSPSSSSSSLSHIACSICLVWTDWVALCGIWKTFNRRIFHTRWMTVGRTHFEGAQSSLPAKAQKVAVLKKASNAPIWGRGGGRVVDGNRFK